MKIEITDNQSADIPEVPDDMDMCDYCGVGKNIDELEWVVGTTTIICQDCKDKAHAPTCFSCGHTLDDIGICPNLLCSGPFTAGG